MPDGVPLQFDDWTARAGIFANPRRRRSILVPDSGIARRARIRTDRLGRQAHGRRPRPDRRRSLRSAKRSRQTLCLEFDDRVPLDPQGQGRALEFASLARRSHDHAGTGLENVVEVQGVLRVHDINALRSIRTIAEIHLDPAASSVSMDRDDGGVSGLRGIPIR